MASVANAVEPDIDPGAPQAVGRLASLILDRFDGSVTIKFEAGKVTYVAT